MPALLLFALAAAAAAQPGAAAAPASDAEIVRLIVADFKEPPLSDAQKAAVERFVRDADPAHKALLPDFLTQRLDPAAKRRFLAAAPDHSAASDDFYARAVAGLNAALGERGYAMPLKPLLTPAALPPGLDTPHIRLMARATTVKDPRERVKLYTEALASVGALDLRLSSALAYYERGMAYLELHDVPRAFDDLTTGLTLYPGHPNGLYNHAVAAMQLELWGDAVRDMTKLLEALPEFPPAYSLRASARAELGEHAAALRDLDRAVGLDPADFWVRLARGTELGLNGRLEEAVYDFDAAVRLSTGSALGYDGLGYTYLDLGKDERAANAFEESIRLDPAGPGAHAGLAVSHLRRGDRAAASSVYARAVALQGLFDVSAAGVTLKGRRWVPAPGGGESMETYRFSPRTAADIDALIRLRRR